MMFLNISSMFLSIEDLYIVDIAASNR